MKQAGLGHYLDFQNNKRLPWGWTAGLIVAALQSCSTPSAPQAERFGNLHETESFKAYWYSGKAEISTYKLDQSRYGENRDGRAVLIFVTEDFSRKQHIKLDHPTAAGGDKISVLKMNFTKNFVTGIYPYSMMLSVFSPIVRRQYSHALKATMSSQEWCGHVYSQMDLSGKRYAFQGHSYFEKEGEQKFLVRATWLEDELWNVIRLDPENLPLGEIKIIPGLFFTRLNHVEGNPIKGIAHKIENDDEVRYSIRLPGQERTLEIRYQKAFPYKILGWEESFRDRSREFHTKAILDKTLYIDYWTKNKNEFLYLRDSLGLSSHNF